MGWETRERGTRYYYRSRRDGDRVLKEYVGAGLAGELAAQADRIGREVREARALEEKQNLERLHALSAPITELSEAADILVRAHMIAAGCHRHKREWRRATREYST